MNMIRSISRKIQITGELVGFFGGNRWWMLPIVIVVLILGVVMVVAEATSLAPFIYTMF